MIENSQKFKSLKSFSASLGHVKRKLDKNEKLTGKTLDTALYALNSITDKSNEEFIVNLQGKLLKGTPLNDEEYSYIFDVVFIHARLHFLEFNKM